MQRHVTAERTVTGAAGQTDPQALLPQVEATFAGLREQRGLACYPACSTDMPDGGGRFVIELSTAPAPLCG